MKVFVFPQQVVYVQEIQMFEVKVFQRKGKMSNGFYFM